MTKHKHFYGQFKLLEQEIRGLFSTKVSGRIGYVSCNSTSCFESIGEFFSRRIWQKERYNMASADSLLRS